MYCKENFLSNLKLSVNQNSFHNSPFTALQNPVNCTITQSFNPSNFLSKIPSTFLEKIIGKVLFDERFSSHDNLILFQMIFWSQFSIYRKNQIIDFNLFWGDENSAEKWFLILVKFWNLFSGIFLEVMSCCKWKWNKGSPLKKTINLMRCQ